MFSCPLVSLPAEVREAVRLPADRRAQFQPDGPLVIVSGGQKDWHDFAMIWAIPQRPLSADITSVVSSRVRLATKLPLDNQLGQ
jgi:hypothetical protein